MINLMINIQPFTFHKLAINLLIGMILIVTFISCQPTPYPKSDLSKVEKLMNSAEMKKAEALADSIKSAFKLNSTDLLKLDSIIDLGQRIQLDFSLTEADVKKQLSKYYPDLDSTMLQNWEKNLKLEMRMINGEKRYFKNAVANLFRLDDLARKKRDEVNGCVADSLKLFCLKHTQQVIENTLVSGEPVLPVHMILTYTLQVKPNAVPNEETIRCWMPFPRTGNLRQTNVKLISSDPEVTLVAPESALQRTVYLEKLAIADQPTVFQIKIELETTAQYFNLNPDEIKRYDTESAIYKEFTKERLPQISFTPEMMNLGAQIISGETNPLLKVRKIYKWIDDSIRWASALEYCTMPDIPAYVLKTGHGDCGMKTLLFMTLARSQGIPVKWQSGWMLHPGEVNLHDWCEVYYEGIGWVPLDMSFGLQDSANDQIHNFYNTGIDSYRMIVNDDYGRELSPAKHYMRSEPYDFQRGELEWSGGNLYFDQWSWHMDVEYN